MGVCWLSPLTVWWWLLQQIGHTTRVGWDNESWVGDVTLWRGSGLPGDAREPVPAAPFASASLNAGAVRYNDDGERTESRSARDVRESCSVQVMVCVAGAKQ